MAVKLDINEYFYIFSYPRSGNTWLVNSLKEYLGAQRAEIIPTVYGGDLVALSNDVKARIAGKYSPDNIVGVKSHCFRSEFVKSLSPRNKIVYIYRDPRDVMISYYFYLNNFLTNSDDDFDSEKFGKHLEKHLPEWKNHILGWSVLYEFKQDLLMVKYEDMKTDYIGCLERIGDFLNIEPICDILEVKHKFRDNFKGMDSHTKDVLIGKNNSFYRKGVIGDWKNYYNDYHKNIVKKHLGDLLIDLGFEKNSNW